MPKGLDRLFYVIGVLGVKLVSYQIEGDNEWNKIYLKKCPTPLKVEWC